MLPSPPLGTPFSLSWIWIGSQPLGRRKCFLLARLRLQGPAVFTSPPSPTELKGLKFLLVEINPHRHLQLAACLAALLPPCQNWFPFRSPSASSCSALPNHSDPRRFLEGSKSSALHCPFDTHQGDCSAVERLLESSPLSVVGKRKAELGRTGARQRKASAVEGALPAESEGLWLQHQLFQAAGRSGGFHLLCHEHMQAAGVCIVEAAFILGRSIQPPAVGNKFRENQPKLPGGTGSIWYALLPCTQLWARQGLAGAWGNRGSKQGKALPHPDSSGGESQA